MENRDGNISLKYRQIFMSVTAIKVKQSKLYELESELSTDRYNSLKDEFDEELNLLNPQLVELESRMHADVSSLKKDIIAFKKELQNIEPNLQEAETIFQNNIIDDIQYKKEKTILEKKKTNLTNNIDLYRRELAEIQMALNFPNPEDEAKVVKKREEEEKEKRLKIEKEEKELIENAEKRKWDFNFQVNQKVQSIQEKLNAKINRLNKEIDESKKIQNSIETENQSLKIKINEFEEDLKHTEKKSAKYKSKIKYLHEELEKKSSPCPDPNCRGSICLDELCNHCGRDYETARKDYVSRLIILDIEEKKRKFRRWIKIFIGMQLLLLIIFNSPPALYLVLGIIIWTIIFWGGKISAYNTEILNIKDYGPVGDQELFDTNYHEDINRLKEEIEMLKHEK